MALPAIKGGPCGKGLTAACFARNPAFARQAFAYRLLHTITPKPLARKLPEVLSKALIGEGARVPPGWNLPPGTVVPPGAILPPPPTEAPGQVPVGAPPEAAPGAPAPSPITPPPPGVLPPPGGALPPGAPGVVPPLYVPPWTPGPVDVPGKNKAGGGATSVEVSIVADSSDGYMIKTDATWSVARGAASATLKDVVDDYFASGMSSTELSGSYYIYRSWFIFDLSSIPSGATITRAILQIAGVNYAATDVCAQQGTQSVPLDLTDFQAFTGAIFGSVAWQESSIPGYTTNEIEFNAAGLSYLSGVIGGNAKLCARDHTYDFLNIAPVGNQANGLYYTETSVVAGRPALNIIYTI